MNILFSIIIPVYNSDKFLSECIDSLINQNNTKTEIILINDHSLDNSKEICNEYKRKYSFITTIHNKKNYGVGVSRNLGINKSKGKYLIFVDSDDCLHKDSLSNLEKNIKDNSNPEVVFVRFTKITYPISNYKLIKANINNENDERKFINYLIKSKFPFADCWLLVAKRNFLLRNNILFPEIRFGESELFVIKIITLMKKYSCMKFLFYDKRDRDSSLNHSKDYYATLSTLILILDFCFFINNYSLSKFKKNFIMSYIQDALGIFTSLLILRNSKEIKYLTKKMQKEKNNISFLKKLPEGLLLDKYLKTNRKSKGLIDYRNNIIQYHYQSLKDIFLNYKYFFCYCRSKYSETTIKFLRKYNININGVIDDNDKFKNTKFLNFKTIDSPTFFVKYSSKLKECAIIINHQRTNTSDKIITSLTKRGLSKKQIKVIKF